MTTVVTASGVAKLVLNGIADPALTNDAGTTSQKRALQLAIAGGLDPIDANQLLQQFLDGSQDAYDRLLPAITTGVPIVFGKPA
jgi:hypothetical protein